MSRRQNAIHGPGCEDMIHYDVRGLALAIFTLILYSGSMRCWLLRELSVIAVFASASAVAAAVEPAVSGTLNRYCVACHNAKNKTAGVALDTLMAEDPSRHPETREKVVRRMRARYMPPIGLPRPDERTYEAVTASLESSLDATARVKPNPGRVDTFRRMNRSEYQNAIRDLLAIDVDLSALLPADESGHGFDNVTVSDLSPALLERYVGAAKKISRLAIGIPPRSPGGETVQLPPDLTQEEHFDPLPLGTRGGTSVRYHFPLDAVYEIQVRLARDRNEHVEGLNRPSEVEVTIDGERVKLFKVSPPSNRNDHSMVDQELNVRVPVKAGPHLVAAAFPKRPSILLETERQPYQAHFNMDRHPRIQPAVYTLTINGPYEVSGPGDTPSRRRIFVCKPSSAGGEDACAKQIMSRLLRGAYRRPVIDADLKSPMKFFRDAKSNGFDRGIEMALCAVLVSPEFLFRVEQDPPGIAPNTAYSISDLEFATRLSFFLWSSIPDEPLLAAAAQGKLRTPAVLESQVRRMLADPRSQALGTNFAGQWLRLRSLASITPDMRGFPDFDDNLRQAFRTETEMLFETVVKEDRSVLDLLSARFTFVNERLAKHYGIPNIYGSRFRRVDLDKDSVRGGLLRQGSILMVTSYATRTSPVIRGKWILENMLGTAPPPPPATVPPLRENASGLKFLSMRERMAEHRANPACSGCHQLMDPVGFSLENYDAVGRWRTAEEGKPIDSAGGLPDGRKFDGAAGLQKALLDRPDLFAQTLTEKLLTYGLGRGIEYYDGPAVRKITRDAKAKGYTFSSFIFGIASSMPFQMRRSQ